MREQRHVMKTVRCSGSDDMDSESAEEMAHSNNPNTGPGVEV